MDLLSIATDGYLSNSDYRNLIAIATRGYIVPPLFVIARGDFPFSGGGEQKGETRKERILREDEEILTFIKAFIEQWEV